MIRLQAATLADAASVREGLVSVLGGGISLLSRVAYPSAIGAALVLIVEFSEEAPGTAHQIEITVKPRGGDEIVAEFRAEVGTLAGAEADEDGNVAIVTMPVVLPLQNVQIPSAGHYEVQVLGDGNVIGGARVDAVMIQNDDSFNPEWF